MQAVVFPERETIAVEQVADPVCGPNDAVVRVRACGICGTDHHIYKGEFFPTYPLIPGHELGGEVVEVGKDVQVVQVGDRVAVDPSIYCGECYFCRQQFNNHCLHFQAVGVTRNGGFAEYVAVPARNCYRIPDHLSFQEAAFVEPLSCVVYAMHRLRVCAGDEVLIFGAGPMGLLLLQALQRSGASRTVVVDKRENRLALAREIGAYAVVVAGPDQKAELESYAPYGYAVVVDATGVPEVVQQAFQHLKPRGQYLQFGVTPPTATVQVSPYDVYRHDWHIIGSFALCYNFNASIAWLESGAVDVKPLVSHFLPLDRFQEGFELSRSGEALKVQLAVPPLNPV